MPSSSADHAGEVDVVFVCTGNRARSPLAAAMLRRHVHGLPVRVRSRGTMEVGSAAPLRDMVIAAQGLGIDLSAHRACSIGAGELAQADLVIGFEPFHVAAAVVEGGARPDVSFTLAELASLVPPGVGRGSSPDRALERRLAEELRHANVLRAGRSRLSAASIDDPFGAGQAMFDRLAREIHDLVGDVATALFGVAAGSARPVER